MSANSSAHMRLCDEPAERELLGCLLVDVDLRQTARRILRPDDFYLYHHRLICQAIYMSGTAEFYRIAQALAEHSLLIDMGGEDYIRSLAVQVENYAGAFPDMHRELYQLYVSGNIVVVQLALQGTHLGPLHLPAGTLPPTGPTSCPATTS